MPTGLYVQISHGPCGREQHAHFAARHALEGFHPFARDLGVRFGLAETLAGWIQGNRCLVENCLKVREPSLGLRHSLRDYDEKSGWQAARKRGQHHRIAGPRQPTHR